MVVCQASVRTKSQSGWKLGHPFVPTHRLLALPPTAGRSEVALCCGTSLVPHCAPQPGLMLLPDIVHSGLLRAAFGSSVGLV